MEIQLRAQIANLERQIHDGELNKVDQSHLNAQIDLLKETIENHNTQQDSLQEQITKLESDKESLEKDLLHQKKYGHDLASEKQTLIEKHQSALQALTKDFQAQLATLAGQNDSIHQELAKQKEEAKQLQVKFDTDLKMATQELESKHQAQLQDATSKLTSALKDKDVLVTGLTNASEAAEQKLSFVVQTVESKKKLFDTKATALEARLAKVQRAAVVQASKHTEQVAALESRVKEFQSAHAAKEAQVHELSKTLAAQQASVEEHKQAAILA